MECPFRLVRRVSTANTDTDAHLLLSRDFTALAKLRVDTGGALPRIHTVHGGFLVIPAENSFTLPGTVRLRRLAGDLYIPADGDLIPSLLPDEMVALTRNAGLIVLPGGEALSFDPAHPLSVTQWLAPPRVERAEWLPFPHRPERAEKLTAIEGPPAPVAVDILGEGAPPDARPLPGPDPRSSGAAAEVPADARPEDSSLARKIVEGTRLGAGQFLTWLGRNLQAPDLAKLGGNLARKALERVPRLTERVLGEQEAALREVLRQLQSGDIERALRRAPIAVPDPEAQGSIGTNADLGTRDPRYSLRDLIGSSGPASGWLGGGDVWYRLAEQYRQLARDAAARGDHRRAAYLYGVLLRDLRSAANVLMSGGLYRDAAVVFRDRIKDLSAAANAFEQAGDYDEALRLYDQTGQYERAADLLRRIGDEERARVYFLRAAENLAGRQHWLAAGDLVRVKAGDRDRAVTYYRRGWESRTAEVVPCGERLLDDHLATEQWPAVHALLDEAESAFAPPRTKEAGRFFNYARKVGEDFLPPAARDDLADRTRLLFANHLRSRAAAGSAADAVSELFGRDGNWTGPIARDAGFATRKVVQKSPSQEIEPGAPLRITDGTVRAVVKARESFDLVVATTTAVVCWRVNSGQVVPICQTNGREVLGLSTDPHAQVVYVLFGETDKVILHRYSAKQATLFESIGQADLSVLEGVVEGWHCPWYLPPTTWTHATGQSITVFTPESRVNLIGPFLRKESCLFHTAPQFAVHLFAVLENGLIWWWENQVLRLYSAPPGTVPTECTMSENWVPAWRPAIPTGSSLALPHLDWLAQGGGNLEIVGIDGGSNLYHSEFDRRGVDAPYTQAAVATHPNRFMAACLTSPRKVAAVTASNEVHWFRVIGKELKETAPPITLAIPTQAVALVSRPQEVLVVFEDGSVMRVPRP